jgi:hypothetical protein
MVLGLMGNWPKRSLRIRETVDLLRRQCAANSASVTLGDEGDVLGFSLDLIKFFLATDLSK